MNRVTTFVCALYKFGALRKDKRRFIFSRPISSFMNDTKRVFLKMGACSHTLFYILNREFGVRKEEEEHASDPLAGGIMQQGYQCGMLWGAALAVGAESCRRHADRGQAIAHAITTTQQVLASFTERAGSANCSDITSCDFQRKSGLVKYLLTGGPITCFHLADKWVPEAIQSAHEGFSRNPTDVPEEPMSCASEVAKQMGATDEGMIMVAGFAGGLGLSGNACGALSAALWMNTLSRVKRHNYKYSLSDPETDTILEAFHQATDYEMECCNISGQCFETIQEHTAFIRNGGCKKLIDVLAQASLRDPGGLPDNRENIHPALD